MEIQKIFSEVNTDEKLYSVLMNEEELALFSALEKKNELEQREFGNKQNKALKNRFISEHFGGYGRYESNPAKALANARRTIKTEEISRFAGANPSQNFFLIGNGSYKGVNGVIDNKVKKTKGNLISQLSEDNRKKFLEKHNLTYDLESNSYIRKPTPSSASATETVNQTTTNAAKDTVKTAAQESTKKAAQVKKGSGMLKKGMKWANKNRVGLGIAAGTTALAGGGAYLYNKAKKKNQDKNNNQ